MRAIETGAMTRTVDGVGVVREGGDADSAPYVDADRPERVPGARSGPSRSSSAAFLAAPQR